MRAEALVHQHSCPDAAGGAQLGDLLEEIVVDVEEERQPRREGVDIQPALDSALARRSKPSASVNANS
ncbi:MAG: hypothetical protein U5K74_03405 [Gemmatimonadaceae bacterium]|nr:hypothetical protein [Gemmatimonadaceae bacterium]